MGAMLQTLPVLTAQLNNPNIQGHVELPHSAYPPHSPAFPSPSVFGSPSTGPSFAYPPLSQQNIDNTSEASPQVFLTSFLSTLTPLASSHPSLFQPHLVALLSFIPGLLMNAEEGMELETPTVGRPFPGNGGFTATTPVSGGSGEGRQGAFIFPPPNSNSSLLSPNQQGKTTPTRGVFPSSPHSTNYSSLKEERTQLRLGALEFMLSLSEAKPSMVRRVDGWVGVLVRACLEGMGELDEGESEPGREEEVLNEWRAEDVSAALQNKHTRLTVSNSALRRFG